ncbi:MAG: hypothetical protein IKL65_05855 [Bacilli bacterium]|nr:hypothetical protein [Bacilli bacterium]
MYVLSINMWFQTLMKQFFFGIDQVVYNGISSIYNLLIAIARTSVLTQADILDMADRIYKLLAIFMIFKVTLSLITYIVNPDDFSDKSKGISKLSMNIIISLGLLILTPYIFNMAYRLQTIILEDNTLGTLIFGGGDNNTSSDFINSAGDDMAFITMSAFFSPNTSITEFQECVELTVQETKTVNGKQTSVTKFNPKCSGLKTDGTYEQDPSLGKTMATLAGTDKFSMMALQNYVVGVENRNLGLMFRTEIAVATVKDNSQFVMDYKYVFSTVVGVVVVLLLISFCMDIALRSIKLAFLQLIAPIPILSYVDPKSGKDGMFKKWYQLCFKTYLSLFIRILALYFAIYIIEKVADLTLVDIVDGTYQVNPYIKIFIIIGALMFAKDLPKILEGLGIKLDGDGKFFLNPLKKFEEQAMGGKRITGAAGGMVAGAVGGHGFFGRIGSAFTGAARGAAANKGYSGGLARQAEVNRKLREARINGAGFWGSRAAVLSSRYGLDDADLEKRATALRVNKKNLNDAATSVERDVKTKEAEKKRIQESIADSKRSISDHKRMQDAISSMESRAKSEIEAGNGGDIGKRYLTLKANAEYLENNIGRRVKVNGKSVTVTPEMAAEAQHAANTWLTDSGMKEYMSQASEGVFSDGKDDKTFQNAYKTYVDAAKVLGIESTSDGSAIHTQYGQSKGTVGDIEREIAPEERLISDIDDQIRKIQTDKKVIIDGKEVSYEDAKAIIEATEKELNEEKERRKTNRDAAATRRIGNGS